MYTCEGVYPSRRSHTALLHLRYYVWLSPVVVLTIYVTVYPCRLSQPSLYNTGGLLPTNGPDWYKIRKPLQKPVVTAVAAAGFIPSIDQVMMDVVDYIQENKEVFRNRDFLAELNKIFLETTGVVTLEHRFDCLHTSLDQESLPARLIAAAENTNSNILSTDNGLPLWRIYETQDYREIRESQTIIARVARQFVQMKIDNTELEVEDHDDKKTLLEHWLGSKDLDTNDVATAVEDFLLAGIHTSSYTMGFLLYHVANNPRVQDRLRQECQEVLHESGDIITKKTLTAATYAAAVLKESLRMNPVSIGAGRILAEDAVCGGYQVPAGTVLVSQNQVSCRLEQFFENPDTFDPERWLSDSLGNDVHKYLVLPFGSGPRGCIGKSIAETTLLMFIIRFFSQFTISWEGDTLDCKTLLINKPDSDLLFTIQ